MIEQSQADKLLKLEIAYSNLYQAYVSGDIDDMKNKYIAVGNVGIPNLESLVHNKTKQRMLSEGILPTKFPIPIYDIEDETLLRINTKGCLDALQDEINNLNIYQSNYIFAKNVLFQPNRNPERAVRAYAYPPTFGSRRACRPRQRFFALRSRYLYRQLRVGNIRLQRNGLLPRLHLFQQM